MAGPEITITKAENGWVVRALGAIIGETKEALILKEGDYRGVVYFPRKDITMAFLDKSPKTTVCPHKGAAMYFHFAGKNRNLENVAWSYETPQNNVSEIAGYLAFDPALVTVESLS